MEGSAPSRTLLAPRVAAVPGVGFRVQGLGPRMQKPESRVGVEVCKVNVVGFRVCRLRVYGFTGSGFRVLLSAHNTFSALAPSFKMKG